MSEVSQGVERGREARSETLNTQYLILVLRTLIPYFIKV
jgi:hypothetical protein